MSLSNLLFTLAAFTATVPASADTLSDIADYLSRQCESTITIAKDGEMKIKGMRRWGRAIDIQFQIKDGHLWINPAAGGQPRFDCNGGKVCIAALELEDVTGYVEKPEKVYISSGQDFSCYVQQGRVPAAIDDLEVHFNGRAKPRTKYD